MPNEIPNAQRLTPPDDHNPKQPTQATSFRTPFIAQVAIVALPIIFGGIFVALKVRVQVGVLPGSALNDTRSPLAEEVSQPNEDQPETAASQDTPGPTTAGTDAPFKLDENADQKVAGSTAYPDIDPDKAPLAVAVNPAIAGLPENENAAADTTPTSKLAPQAAYGHLPYSENDPSRLSSAGSFIRENYERAETLDFEAAQAFELMRQAAKAEGINLMPVSGFRTITAQKDLFESQVNRKGSAEAAAVFSAPPLATANTTPAMPSTSQMLTNRKQILNKALKTHLLINGCSPMPTYMASKNPFPKTTSKESPSSRGIGATSVPHEHNKPSPMPDSYTPAVKRPFDKALPNTHQAPAQNKKRPSIESPT